MFGGALVAGLHVGAGKVRVSPLIIGADFFGLMACGNRVVVVTLGAVGPAQRQQRVVVFGILLQDRFQPGNRGIAMAHAEFEHGVVKLLLKTRHNVCFQHWLIYRMDWKTPQFNTLPEMPRFFFLPAAGAGLSLRRMRILVVEDDAKIASFIAKGLKQMGYAVDACADGEEALVLAETTAYDAAVMDVMLPKLNGLSLIQRLRGRKIQTPIIILSAKATVEDRIKGLQSGADDYLTKPFAFSELAARIQALIRRATQAVEPTRISVGDVHIDLITREVTRGGETVELQSREFALLEYLMRNAGRPVTKTMILEHIFDYSFDPQTNVIDVLVHRLRSKIDPEKTRLQTLRGVGYVLKPATVVP